MRDSGTETRLSIEPGSTWPTKTARVVAALGLAGLGLSIIMTAAQDFQTGGVIAALTMAVVVFYTLAQPAARPDYRSRSDKEQIADVRASGAGFGLSLMIVLATLFAVGLRADQSEPLVVPAALLRMAIPILVAPVFTIPFLFRVWRKNPDKP